ncbi:MAG: hypothetical protein HS112_13495 [Zoogloeaceae bacterium]|nr:hypothetical protein [Zoogloeaceae bacterium]
MAPGTFPAFGLPDRLPPLLRYAAVLLFSSFGGPVPATLFSLAVHRLPTTARFPPPSAGCSNAALGQFIGPPLVARVAGIAGGWQWTGRSPGPARSSACCSPQNCTLAAKVRRRLGNGRGEIFVLLGVSIENYVTA